MHRRLTPSFTWALALTMGVTACADDETSTAGTGGSGGSGSSTTTGSGGDGGGDAVTTTTTTASGGGEGGAGQGGSGGEGGAGQGGSGGAGQGGSGGQGGAPACEAGEERCEDGEHLVCEDGALVAAPCAAGEGCEPSTGACTPCACDPAVGPQCSADGSAVETCDPSCLTLTVAPCAGGEACDGDTDTCATCACDPDAAPACGADGFSVDTCSDTCLDVINTPCAVDEGCDPDAGGCVACACDPDAAPTCLDATTVLGCAASCLEDVVTPCDDASYCSDGACVPDVCVPGSISCVDGDTPQVCNALGSGWDPSPDCAATAECVEAEGCVTLCELAERAPTSEGCSFFALNMDNFNETVADAVVVSNPRLDTSATVSLLQVQGGVEVAIQADVVVAPGGAVTLTLPNAGGDVIEAASELRGDHALRVVSDVPVSAALYSPLTPVATNDSSLLFPEGALGTDHVVASYTDTLGNYPSYLVVVGTVDGTTVEVTAAGATVAGTGVPAMTAGQTVEFVLGRNDVLKIAATPGGDISRARVTASAPVAVFGAAECVNVPAGVAYCDHIEDQMLPLPTWGTTYVAAHAPDRSGLESFRWRFFAGDADTTITTDPAQPGFPALVAAGSFLEIATTESFVISGDQPFAAVQYLTSQEGGAGIGDPAMTMAVPTDRFLDRYALDIVGGYTSSYAQIVRAPGVVVRIDGVAVDAAEFEAVGGFEVADVNLGDGAHVVDGDAPFGLSVFAYTSVTSYAHPAGLSFAD